MSRFFLLLFLLIASSAHAQDTAYPNVTLPEQPNILWLVAEDMSPYLASFGDSTVQTPNLDRLAREGVRYTNMYSISGVCAPSRFAIATGLYPTSGGAQHMRTSSRAEYMEQIGLSPYEAIPPSDVRFMSEVLRTNGYYASNNAKQDYQLKAPVTAWDESSNRAHWRNRPSGMPFFSIFNLGVTHESRIWAKAEDSLWVDPDLDVPIPPYLPRTDLVRQDVLRMYSNIKELDQQIGNVVAQLEEDGLLDSTLIVFYADHGGPLPRQKRQLYDSGLHVPLIVRIPDGQHAGMVDDQLVSFIDLAPTMFSVAGIALPDYLEGQAFLGARRAAEPRRYIHAAADRFDTETDTKRAVRDKRFKYIRNLRPERGYYLAVTYREQMATMQELLRLRDEGGLDEYQAQWFRTSKPVEELFDTQTDPHELHNLADDVNYAEKLDELGAELTAWMARTNDPGTMPESEFLATLWPDHMQPLTVAPGARWEENRVALSSATEGASIGYQVLADGDKPGTHWYVYTEPVTVPAGHRVHVLAHRLGFKPSEAIDLTAPGD